MLLITSSETLQCTEHNTTIRLYSATRRQILNSEQQIYYQKFVLSLPIPAILPIWRAKEALERRSVANRDFYECVFYHDRFKLLKHDNSCVKKTIADIFFSNRNHILHTNHMFIRSTISLTI